LNLNFVVGRNKKMRRRLLLGLALGLIFG
jgi:hypothetical protein